MLCVLVSSELFSTQMSLQKNESLKYLPSELAAASVYLALRVYGHAWTSLLSEETGYVEASVLPAAQMLLSFVLNDNPKFQVQRNAQCWPVISNANRPFAASIRAASTMSHPRQTSLDWFSELATARANHLANS